MNSTLQVSKNALITAEDDYRNRAEVMIKLVHDTVIDSMEAMEKGADLAKGCRSIFNKLEDLRDMKVRPFNEKVKGINANYRTITAPLEQAVDIMKRKMLTFQKDQERIAREEAEARRRMEEEERIAAIEAAKATDMDGNAIGDEVVVPEVQEVTAIAVPEITRSLRGATASVKKTWTYEVTDIVSLSEHRPDLVEGISSKINAAIRDGVRNIPGLRIFQQETMSVR